jgi:hypothetical protein
VVIGKRVLKENPGLSTVTVRGTIAYQACNDKMCFMPASVPFTLEIPLADNDWIDAPE